MKFEIQVGVKGPSIAYYIEIHENNVPSEQLGGIQRAKIKSLGAYVTCTDSKKITACVSEVEYGLKFYSLYLLCVKRKIFSGFICWTWMSNLT